MQRKLLEILDLQIKQRIVNIRALEDMLIFEEESLKKITLLRKQYLKGAIVEEEPSGIFVKADRVSDAINLWSKQDVSHSMPLLSELTGIKLVKLISYKYRKVKVIPEINADKILTVVGGTHIMSQLELVTRRGNLIGDK